MQIDNAQKVLGNVMNQNPSYFVQASTPQHLNASLQIKKGNTLNNSLMATDTFSPHLILQNYGGGGPPLNQFMTKSPQNANNYAPLSPVYTIKKPQKQQVASAMDRNHNNYMIADLSVANDKFINKLPGQKKRRGKSKQSQNLSHEVGR